MSAKQRRLSIEDYLDHIEEAATLASGYVRGMTREVFLPGRHRTGDPLTTLNSVD
jgi:hypothetical protein